MNRTPTRWAPKTEFCSSEIIQESYGASSSPATLNALSPPALSKPSLRKHGTQFRKEYTMQGQKTLWGGTFDSLPLIRKPDADFERLRSTSFEPLTLPAGNVEQSFQTKNSADQKQPSFDSLGLRRAKRATSRALHRALSVLMVARDALVRQFRLPEIDFDPEYMLAEPPPEVIREREAEKRARFEAALLLDDM